MNNTNPDEELKSLRKELETEKELRRKAEQENAAKDKQIAEKELEAEYWKKRSAKNEQIIARAKNISPISRVSLPRVKRLCESACLDVEKVEGGYQMSFGFTLKRFFKKLSHIFDILILDNWYLSDIFKPDFFAPNKYGYVPPNSSFNNSVENSSDDCSSEPISVLKKKVASVGSLTTSVIHEVISSVVGGTRRLAETVDKYGDIVSQKLSSTPFADSYTDETLNQVQNSYDTWDESLDDFSPA
jgi:hypothetical protein